MKELDYETMSTIKDYVVRMLGSPAIPMDLSDAEITSIIEDSFQKIVDARLENRLTKAWIISWIERHAFGMALYNSGRRRLLGMMMNELSDPHRDGFSDMTIGCDDIWEAESDLNAMKKTVRRRKS